MNRRHALAFVGLSTLALALAACKKDEAPQVADDPAAAVADLAKSLRDNDLVRFSRLSVPAPVYARFEQRWEEQKAAAGEITDEDRASFAEGLGRLTAPDAEQTLYAELEPTLVQFETEMAPQLPLMVAMGSGFITASVQQSDTLSDSQKQHASDVIGAIAGWVTTAPLADRDKARQAIGVAVRTARGLGIESADEMQALNFEQAMRKGGEIGGGFKQVLALYGLDLDASLDSVKTENLARNGDQARVRVNYTLAGNPISFEMDMVRQDGGWYSPELIANAQEQLDAPLVEEDEEVEFEIEEDSVEDVE